MSCGVTVFVFPSSLNGSKVTSISFASTAIFSGVIENSSPFAAITIASNAGFLDKSALKSNGFESLLHDASSVNPHNVTEVRFTPFFTSSIKREKNS